MGQGRGGWGRLGGVVGGEEVANRGCPVQEPRGTADLAFQVRSSSFPAPPASLALFPEDNARTAYGAYLSLTASSSVPVLLPDFILHTLPLPQSSCTVHLVFCPL